MSTIVIVVIDIGKPVLIIPWIVIQELDTLKVKKNISLLRCVNILY